MNTSKAVGEWAQNHEGLIYALGLGESAQDELLAHLRTHPATVKESLTDESIKSVIRNFRTTDTPEPDAWMTEDGRTLSGAQKAGLERDGGASASTMRAFSIPLYTRPALSPADSAGDVLREFIEIEELSKARAKADYEAFLTTDPEKEMALLEQSSKLTAEIKRRHKAAWSRARSLAAPKEAL